MGSWSLTGFNPRPVVGLGESFFITHFFVLPFWFQSTPSRWTGRILIHAILTNSCNSFQSTPSRWTGRIGMVANLIAESSMFQSTPSRWTGRIVFNQLYLDVFIVSIHAQSLDWANRELGLIKIDQILVSIHAQSLDWANAWLCLCRLHFPRFNPRPVIGLGESLFTPY